MHYGLRHRRSYTYIYVRVHTYILYVYISRKRAGVSGYARSERTEGQTHIHADIRVC